MKFSAAGATAYPGTNSDLQANLTSPDYPQEEGEVSYWDIEMPAQETDQQISEKQSYRDTIRCVLIGLTPGARV